MGEIVVTVDDAASSADCSTRRSTIPTRAGNSVIYDEHQAIRRAMSKLACMSLKHSTDDVRDRAAVGGALLSTTMVELVESRDTRPHPGDP